MSLYFSLGEELLNGILGGIYEGSLMLVLGHPGAGKTTFASKIIYENCSKYNVKGVYISLAESKDKFYTFMKNIGMDFKSLEDRKLFEFIHIPTLSGEELLEAVTKLIGNKLLNEGYSIVVVDPITPILNILPVSKVRSYLHATIYSLINALKGIVILIADLPYGTESVDLKGLEFIADSVFVFKTKIKRGLIARYVEIRKFRGKEIPMAEIPFTILKGCGLKVLASPPLEDIPLLTIGQSFTAKCVEMVWSVIPRGTYIGLLTEKQTPSSTQWLLLLQLIKENNLSIGIVSFRLPSVEMRHLIESLSRLLKTKVDDIMKRLIFVSSYNPSSLSIHELIGSIRVNVDQDPDILLLHGVEMLYLYYGERIVDRMLRDLALYVRRKGVILFEMCSGIYSKLQLPRYSIVHITYTDERGDMYHKIYRNTPIVIEDKIIGLKPIIINDDNLIKCLSP